MNCLNASSETFFRAALSLVIILLLLFPGVSAALESAAPEEHLPCLYLIGDSTVSDYPPERFPLTGWGQVLQDIFEKEKLHVINRARSGRSSKSFYDEGAWEPVRNQLRKGDFVFIQFGHNDEKKADPARYTEPGTGYREYLTKYIEGSRAHGAVPVLVTPIYRNAWKPGEHLKDTHDAWPPAMRALAREKNVPLLDLHAMTGKRLQALGPEKSSRLFMNLEKGEYPAWPDGRTDNTHLHERGAREICRMIAVEIPGLKTGLETYLKADRAEPAS